MNKRIMTFSLGLLMLAAPMASIKAVSTKHKLYGAGAGIVTLGVISYVLYKNGVTPNKAWKKTKNGFSTVANWAKSFIFSKKETKLRKEERSSKIHNLLGSYTQLLLGAEMVLSPSGKAEVESYNPKVAENFNKFIEHFKNEVQSLTSDQIHEFFDILPTKESLALLLIERYKSPRAFIIRPGNNNETMSQNAQWFCNEWEITLKNLHSKLRSNLSRPHQELIDKLIAYTREVVKEIEVRVGSSKVYDVLHQGMF